MLWEHECEGVGVMERVSSMGLSRFFLVKAASSGEFPPHGRNEGAHLRALNGGFTLVELMIMLLILCIFAAFAIPGFSRWAPDLRLKSAVRDLKSDIEVNRLRAIRENARVAFTFDTGNNRYKIFVDNGAGGGTANNWVHDGGEVLIKEVAMPGGVAMYQASFAGGAARFRFDGRGVPDENTVDAADNHVYMRSSNNACLGISVSFLGQVKVRRSVDGGTTWNDAD